MTQMYKSLYENSTNFVELYNQLKTTPEYKELKSKGFRNISSDRQIEQGTFHFYNHNIERGVAIYANGYVRRFNPGIFKLQGSVLIKMAPINTLADYEARLSVVNHNLFTKWFGTKSSNGLLYKVPEEFYQIKYRTDD